MEEARNWSVAVIGAGPAGLFAADALVKRGAAVDVYEGGFAPYGLVRYGVAPDHQKIKKTQLAFEKILRKSRVRLFANVKIGHDVSVGELRERYDQVVVAVGSPGARTMHIPGENLPGSVSATEFVNWYNGSPDSRDSVFDLSARRAVIVGMGNVAIDVARILVRERGELATTDIAPRALECLRRSKIEEVVLFARRGPNQAAFDIKEVRELASLAGVSVGVSGYVSKRPTKMSEFIAGLPRTEDLPRDGKRVVLHFCQSPKAILGEESVVGIKTERNHLVESALRMKPVGSGEFTEHEAGLVVRSIGYEGQPLEGVPFQYDTASVPHEKGRVLERSDGKPVPGLYVAGWIKRGPTGLIGTNKACSIETVESMEADLDQVGPLRDASAPGCLLRERGVRFLDLEDWLALDAAELKRGKASGCVRRKFADADEALAFLGRPSRGAASGNI